MEKKTPPESAPEFKFQEWAWKEPSMTLRDWFAGQALAGIIGGGNLITTDPNQIARAAYEAADSMLKARGGA